MWTTIALVAIGIACAVYAVSSSVLRDRYMALPLPTRSGASDVDAYRAMWREAGDRMVAFAQLPTVNRWKAARRALRHADRYLALDAAERTSIR